MAAFNDFQAPKNDNILISSADVSEDAGFSSRKNTQPHIISQGRESKQNSLGTTTAVSNLIGGPPRELHAANADQIYKSSTPRFVASNASP